MNPVYLSTSSTSTKQLVAEAGYPQGIELRMLLIALPQHHRAGELLQGMLAKAGIKAVLEPLERLAAIDKNLAGDFDMWPMGRVYMPDPDNQCRDLCSYGSGNRSGLDNKDLDKLFEEGRSTFDLKKRHEAYAKVDRLRVEEAFVPTISVSPEPIFTQKYVLGLDTEWENYDPRSVWLDK